MALAIIGFAAWMATGASNPVTQIIGGLVLALIVFVIGRASRYLFSGY